MQCSMIKVSNMANKWFGLKDDTLMPLWFHIYTHSDTNTATPK